MRKTSAILFVCAVSSSAFAGVHLTVRPDGTKMIYNDEVDTRRYKPIQMSDGWLANRARRPSPYDDLIRAAASQQGMDPALLKSVMLVESGFNPAALSRKGARGLMQLMPATARTYGVADVTDVRENIAGGARYLNYLLNLYHGDLEDALAAYNAGEAAVQKYGGIPPYDETVLYVHKTLTAYYGKPYLGGGFGRATTDRFRALAGFSGRPVRVERDADNRVVITTDTPAVLRRR
ncbi:MAG TPA: lytic transglycosylase domain-containing protein [Thermoanaerobaculia bacterium]|nr:lytic transglycosylase domain-containing protein [Thermoanaerobaculia bacterium]